MQQESQLRDLGQVQSQMLPQVSKIREKLMSMFSTWSLLLMGFDLWVMVPNMFLEGISLEINSCKLIKQCN